MSPRVRRRRALALAVRRRWALALALGVRRRRALALATLVIALAAAGVVLLTPGKGGEAPPASAAARIVPASALVYLHLSTDAGRPGTQRASALATRLPGVGALRDRLLGRLTAAGGGVPVSFQRDIRPWLGREAALALVDVGTGQAVPLLVLDVADRPRAEGFLAQRLASATDAGSYGGVPLRRTGAVVFGFVAHALVAGPEPAMRAAIDASAGKRPALSGDSAYARASEGAPAGRVADLYVSQSGIRLVLLPRGGVLGALASLLDTPGLLGTAASVTAEPGGAGVRVHSALDATIAKGAGGPPPTFVPGLTGALPANPLAVLDVRGLDRALARLAAAGQAGGLPAGAGDLLRGVEPALRGTGVDLRRDVLPLVSGEVALVLTGSSALPVLTLVAAVRDPARAALVLAQVQAPLAQVLARAAGAGGQVPVLQDVTVGGVAVHQLRVGPAFELDYAVFGGRAVLSTQLEGIGAVARPGLRLGSDPRARAVLGDARAPVTSVLFLDPSQLLGLAEQIGLTRDRASGAVRDVLRRVHLVGLRSTAGEADSTAELHLQIP